LAAGCYDATLDHDCDVLINLVDAGFARIFHGWSESERRAVYRYLFAQKPRRVHPSLRNRIICLYDPLADRSLKFPDGLRWCLNVYVGCEHNCSYCYVNSYSRLTVGAAPACKRDFEKRLTRDLRDLKAHGAPPVPLHISNSTDPLQAGLEGRNGHTLLALARIRENRALFTNVVILTKNPGLLCTEPYMAILAAGDFGRLTVQVTCAFWRDEARKFFEPCAPSVQSRLDAIASLAKMGVHVELRIDPLFPASRFAEQLSAHKPLPHYRLPEAQTRDDLLQLVRFARRRRVGAIVAKPLKAPISNKASRCREWFKDLYADANNGKRPTRGGSWRLPDAYRQALVASLADICTREGIAFKTCMQDVLGRR
jgi:DNA repair photolyase